MQIQQGLLFSLARVTLRKFSNRNSSVAKFKKPISHWFMEVQRTTPFPVPPLSGIPQSWQGLDRLMRVMAFPHAPIFV
jgi:hypothetical protein